MSGTEPAATSATEPGATRPAEELTPGLGAASAPPAPARPADDEPSLRPLPSWLAPAYAYPQVRALGRSWPRSGLLERVFWLGLLAGCLVVLWLAGVVLSPDGRGVGTHEQLGLPPCGFVEMFGGLPCPSCGYTTTFTLAAHGRPVAAFVNQPFGFLVFLATVALVPLTLLAGLRGVSLFAMTERWRWGRVVAVTIALWLAAWIYKLIIMSA